MPSIFVSYSSADRSAAEEISRRLLSWGYETFFLDFDPERGIQGGTLWEEALYRNLRRSEALILLCSPSSLASKWCFAELTQAKQLGKKIFPLKIEDCSPDGTIAQYQIIDLRPDPDEGYARLQQSLASEGIDPRDDFAWDHERDPFPGLDSFEEEDVGVYFGRQEEIHKLGEKLSLYHRFFEPRLLVITGPSGCGKSSFLKAGILPRLRKEASRWLVAPAFRPGTDPFGPLGRALADAAARDGQELEGQAIETGLASAEALVDLAVRLTAGEKPSQRRVLVLAIDQLEELLGGHGTAAGPRFLDVLMRALSMSRAPLLVLATLRADSLGTIEQQPAVREAPLEMIALRPMRKAALAEAIERPALRLRIELAPGLVTEIVDDCASSDSLPLLAMTLREMYQRDPARFRLETYRADLGGIEGSVARIVEGVLDRTGRRNETGPLREALLHLVDVQEAGAFLRRPARRDRLPAAAGPVLQLLVEARLLKSGEAEGAPTLEVAHEALFSVWRDLRGWLEEDRPFLQWRRRVSQARQDWERQGSDPDALLRGKLLADADLWLARYPSAIDPADRSYVEISRERQAREAREDLWSHLRLRGTVGFGAGLLPTLLMLVQIFAWNSSTLATLGVVAVGLISGRMFGVARRGLLAFGCGYLGLAILYLLAQASRDVWTGSRWQGSWDGILLAFSAFLLCGVLVGEGGAQGLTRASVAAYGAGGIVAALVRWWLPEQYIGPSSEGWSLWTVTDFLLNALPNAPFGPSLDNGYFVGLCLACLITGPLFGLLAGRQLRRNPRETPEIRGALAKRSRVTLSVFGIIVLSMGIWLALRFVDRSQSDRVQTMTERLELLRYHQERFIKENSRHARTLEELGFDALSSEPDLQIILQAGPAGWSATAKYRSFPDPSCVIWTGRVGSKPQTRHSHRSPERPDEIVCDPTLLVFLPGHEP